MSSFTLSETNSEFTPEFLDGLEHDIVSFPFWGKMAYFHGQTAAVSFRESRFFDLHVDVSGS